MKNVIRLYLPNGSCVKEPEKIMKLLSKPTCEYELDYMEGDRCKMGTAKELVAEPINVDTFDIVIPNH